jgi:hypothetical protein
MKRILLCALTAVAVSVSSFALTAAVAAGDQSAEAAHNERMQHWAADHEAMMDARCAGMKAALKLTPEQNPLWEAFENAVRGAGKARMDDMGQMMENASVWTPWPVIWLDAPTNLRRSPKRPNHFTAASTRRRSTSSNCLATR